MGWGVGTGVKRAGREAFIKKKYVEKCWVVGGGGEDGGGGGGGGGEGEGGGVV